MGASEIMELIPLYFGCKNVPGHYCWNPDGTYAPRAEKGVIVLSPCKFMMLNRPGRLNGQRGPSPNRRMRKLINKAITRWAKHFNIER